MLLTPSQLARVTTPRYFAAGDPAPAIAAIAPPPIPVSTASGPILVVRALSGAPRASFYGTERGAENIATAERAELSLQSNGAFAVFRQGGTSTGPVAVWAVAPDGRVLDRVVVTTPSTLDFSASGRLVAPGSSGLPKWVAPVAIVGVLGAIGAAVVLSR